MKKKLPMQQLIEWLYSDDCHIDMYAISCVKDKARELLSVEKDEIASAYSMGAIDEDLKSEEEMPNFTGAYDYIEKTFEQ